MRVTLAYPFDGHSPDETVDLDDATAKRLLRDGFARLPDRDTQTVAELRGYAKRQGIDISGLSRKADITAAIQAAEQPRVTPVTTVTPVSGEED